jgi:hypothetical protein
MGTLMPDFTKLIEQFQKTKDHSIEKLLKVMEISPDTTIYVIQTNKGVFYVYEIDFISSFKDVENEVREYIGNHYEFYPVQQPLAFFKETGPVQASQLYQKPDDWDMISTYCTDKFTSKPYYFAFLIEKLMVPAEKRFKTGQRLK